MRYVLHRRLTNLTVRRRGRINTAHTKIAAMPAGQPIEIDATQRFGNGYFDQSAEIWGTDGALLATTHQLVYFKD